MALAAPLSSLGRPLVVQRQRHVANSTTAAPLALQRPAAVAPARRGSSLAGVPTPLRPCGRRCGVLTRASGESNNGKPITRDFGTTTPPAPRRNILNSIWDADLRGQLL